MRRAALLVALAACGTSERAGSIGNRSAPTAAPADAASPADASTCVADCVHARQMVAMSIAAITAQCERDCATAAP